MKSLPLLLTASLLTTLSGCVVHVGGDGSSWRGGFLGLHESSGGGLRGDGEAGAEERVVPEFDSVEISGAFEVRLQVGGASGVRLAGDANLLEHVTTRVVDGVLKVRPERSLSPVRPLELDVSTPTLAGLALSGSSTVELSGLAGGALDLALSGSNRFLASGRVDRLTLAASGSQAVDLHGLIAREATVALSGSSDVRLHVEERLGIESSGSSRVELEGEARLTRLSQSGSLQVERGAD